MNLFFQLLNIMRNRTQEFTGYGLKSRSGQEIDMLFVKAEPNTRRIGQFSCNRQLILSYGKLSAPSQFSPFFLKYPNTITS